MFIIYWNTLDAFHTHKNYIK